MRRLRFVAMVLALALVCAPLSTLAEGPESRATRNPAASAVRPASADIPLAARVKIDPQVLKQLLEASRDAQRQGKDHGAPVTYLVYLSERAPLGDLLAAPDPKLLRQRLVERLQTTAERSQAGVAVYLELQRQKGNVRRYQSYWVFNGLAVDGDLETALQLALRPEVEAIRPNRIHRLPPPTQQTEADPKPQNQPEWGVAKIGADRVWRYLGITGAGVVVANMDSGVDWTHPALQRKYRGYNPGNPAASTHDYNWIDFTRTYTNAPGPNQPHISTVSDHGTHTMGTMLGSEPGDRNVVGVAPGATWIAVKVFDDQGNASDEDLHKGFQWCLAPTDRSGAHPNPSKAPDIVNNSWGDDNGADETFRQDITAFNAAGIFCTFSTGNAGPAPRTVGSPASLPNAFAVGATDARDEAASFSSRGPSPWEETKPEVAAPGVNIRSCIAGGGYESGWNGTSMAAPHVAGLAALLMEAARIAGGAGSQAPAAGGLSIEATRYLITSTAVDLGAPGEDNTFGYGRVDAYQAVGAVTQPGTFAGRVTEEGSGAPLANASVTMRNLMTGGHTSARTDAAGAYSFAVGQGLYNVTASKFGYNDVTVPSVQVLANTLTQLDFALRPCPSGVIRGRVTFSPTGQPVAAMVRVAGTPAEATVDGQGYYSLTVPAGTYTIRATAAQPGYRGSETPDVIMAAGGALTLNFALSSAPRILLVNADAWLPADTLGYYRDALDGLLYSYDALEVLDPPRGNPTADKLAQYDIVLWSEARGSPGYIGAWGALGAYLDRGGRLFISGEDIGYWDEEEGQGAESYHRYLHANYLGDSAGLALLTGVQGEILEDIQLRYNTEDSAKNQVAPDLIEAADALARVIVVPHPGAATGLRTDACTHRVVYLSFGLEGTGPAPARMEVLSRALAWLSASRPPQGVSLSVPASSRPGLLGSTVSFDFTVANDGRGPARFHLSAVSPTLPARILNGAGQEVSETGELTPCGTMPLRVVVSVPLSAPVGLTAETTVRVVSASSPQISATHTMSTLISRPWARVANLPTPRYRLGSAVSECALYTFGGMLNDEDSTITNTVEILDLRTGIWSAGSRKPTRAANYGLAQLGGQVYIIGGWDPTAPMAMLDRVEVYDLAADRWTAAPPLPRPLAGLAATAFGGRVYAFGGRGPEGASRATFIYDPATRTWSEGAPLSADVAYGAAVSVGEAIYVAGGWPARTELLRYDPAGDTWTEVAPMSTGRQSFAMVAAEGFIYVAGGGDEWAGLNSVERFDPASGTWVELLPLQVGDRAGCSGTYADGRFFVLGGASLGAAAVESYDIRVPLSGSQLSVSPSIVKPGDVATYSLMLRSPYQPGTRVSWRMPLPDLLEYVPGSGTGGAAYDAARRELSWAGDLPAASQTLFGFQAKVHAVVTDGVTISSTVTVDCGTCKPSTLVAILRVSIPSLGRSIKTVREAEVAPGGELHYTIDVVNGSPFTITNAVLTDSIPQHTTFVPGSVDGGTYNAALNRIEWTGAVPPADTGAAAFRWIDATPGRALALTDDSCVGPLDLGFEFEFYGQRYSQVYVNSNGMVLFESCNHAYRNVSIPSPSEPNAFVAPFWDDINPGAQSVFLATFGAPPRRYAVVEWRDVSAYGETDTQTFEVVLYEGSNSVVFQYLELNGERGSGSSATVGIEDQSGTSGVQYLLDGAPSDHALHDGLAIEMLHPSTRRASVHSVSYAVRVRDAVPPFTVVTNTALISDGYAIHQCSISSTVYSPVLGTSSKTVEPTRARSGDEVAYRIHLVNSGRLSATDLVLHDALPEGLSYVPGSLTGAGATYNEALRRIEWTGTVTPASEGISITYVARLAGGLRENTWITNTAEATMQGVTMASLQAGLLVNEVTLESSTKAVSRELAPAGEAVTYTITLRNSGLAAANTVTMTDALPAEVALVTDSLQGGSYDALARVVQWAGALGPGGEHVVRFQASLGANARNGTVVTNTVAIACGATPTLSRTAALTVLRGDLSRSDMAVTPAWLLPGQAVTYTIRLRNTGAVQMAARLDSHLPAPLEVVPGSEFASSGTMGLEDRKVSWNGTMLPQAMVILRFRATALLGSSPGSAVTEATIVDAGGLEYVLRARVIVNAHLQYLPLVHQR